MPSFSYVGYSHDGAKRRGAIEALDRSNALQRLRDEGIKVLELVPEDRESEKRVALTLRLFQPQADYRRFFADLAMLTEAGLRLDRALKTIADEKSNNANRVLASDLLARLSNGQSPSGAFQIIEESNPGAVALISGAEHTNKLHSVFAVIAEDLERRRDRQNKIIEAVAYPAFLLVMMVAAIALITLFLVPAILPVFEGTGVQPPILVRVLSSLGSFFRNWAAIGALTLLVGGLVFSRVSGRKRTLALILLPSLPFIGKVLRAHWLSRYLRTLALLLGNSVSMEKALTLSAMTCKMPSYYAKLNIVRDGVVGGKHLPEALAEAGVFSPAVTSLISIGDEVNSLPTVLDRAASLLEEEAGRLEKLLLGILTPSITIIMGVLIGTLIISVMSALLSINQMSLQ